ncbi:oligosaccharide flippase family protein [Haloplanus rallus]|uniref:oligosaccharide flippase family protein n=1 Tax=Haloplanus rallus TaxID=1816183 RepID=UPI001E2B2423|nr:polysaccharide biosynthesis C-terminal domain-containing protein [Haloplanus rallus]
MATLYIARLLGAAPLGIYHLGIGLVSWLAIAGKIGVSGAISKRVSEGDEQGEYTVAGAVLVGSLFVVVAAGVLLFRARVNAYVGYPAAGFVVAILFATLAYSVVRSVLTGLHLVHISGILSPVKIGGRSLLQILAVVSSLGVAGLFWGHLAGIGLVLAVGLFIAVRNLPSLGVPRKRHFHSLLEFAKFSWLGSLQSRMFNYTDVIVLGFFVSSSLIGIYSVAWNVAQFLILFSGALSSTLFPEMSELSAQHDPQAAANVVEESLAYGGLFLIPGVFGGALLGDRILQLYGPEFTQGTAVLFVLIVANLFMGYQNQLLNALNAVDRPELSFRVNTAFVGVNLSFNVLLVYLYGWLGAAVATAGSVAISLVLAYWYLSGIVSFDLPIGEILRQGGAGTIMAAVVYIGLTVEDTYHLLNHNLATVLVLVGLGAGVYFATLLVLSTRFRSTVRRNLPPLEPYLSW